MVKLIFLFLLIIYEIQAEDTRPYFLSDEFIDSINKGQNTWRAGRNFHPDTSFKYISSLTGSLPNDHLISMLPKKIYSQEFIDSLPEQFDAREKWTQCPSLRDIRDQGSCGSCWAISTAAVLTDRECTFSNGKFNFYYSTNDIISCCRNCGFGCRGGLPILALQYWIEHGVVSGGPYNSSQGCRPYEITPCEHHVTGGDRPPCNKTLSDTPSCKNECQPNYNQSYDKDKRRGKTFHTLPREEDIKADLFKNGPVTVSYTVYEDFFVYKEGVYIHKEGEERVGHAVKLIGWGVENGTKYWLIANSWNTDWGDKGFFKFLRGENHCGIESAAVTGEPLTHY